MTLLPPTVAEPSIESIGPLRLVGLCRRYACQDTSGIFAQWGEFSRMGGSLPPPRDDNAYGACRDPGPEEFDYLCAISVSDDPVPLTEPMQSWQIPQAQYALFRDRGHISGIKPLLSTIFQTWLPQSDWQIAPLPVIECYHEEFNPQTGEGGYEVWIPVRPRT